PTRFPYTTLFRSAARKAQGLLDAGATVHVVASQVGDAVRALPGVTFDERPYAAGDLDGCALVIAATGDADVDHRVFLDAQARGIWVNAADDPANCTFTLPAQLRRGARLVPVSTAVRSPAISSWLRDRLDAQLGPEYEVLVDLVAEERERVQRAGRSTEGIDWRNAIDSGKLLELIREGRLAEA